MRTSFKLSTLFANSTIWIAIILGFLFECLFIPQLSSELDATYVELRGAGLIIQCFLLALVFACQMSLFCVSFLLRLLVKDRILSENSLGWANLLAASSLLISLLCFGLLVWLTLRGAASPGVALVLIMVSLFTSSIGFVTHSLKGLLIKAISNSAELAGVI